MGPVEPAKGFYGEGNALAVPVFNIRVLVIPTIISVFIKKILLLLLVSDLGEGQS